MRSEGNKLLEAVDELIAISKQSGAPAEIYHFKQAGKANWDKLDAVIARVEAARASGQRITADMYTYTAGRHRPRRGDADVGAVGRARGMDQAAEGPGDPRAADQGNAHAVQ